MRAWLEAHGWKLLLPALVLGAALGYLGHGEPEPAVDLHEVSQSATDRDLVRREEAGPVDMKGRWTFYGPTPAPQPPARPASPAAAPATPGSPAAAVPCPVAATLDFEEHRGPTSAETHATEAHRESRDLTLKITPAPRPAWAFSLGIEDVLGRREPRFALRHRLFGLGPCESVWVEGSIRPRIARPLESEVGAAVACDVR